MPSPKAEALFFSSSLLGVSLFRLYYFNEYTASTASTFLLFVVLLINSYYSLRYFFPLIKKTTTQTAFDIALFISYLSAIEAFAKPLPFLFSMVTIFALTVIKYSLARKDLVDKHALDKKIILNISGFFCFIVASLLAFLGYEEKVLIVLFLSFTFISFYLRFFTKLYKTSVYYSENNERHS